MSKPIVIYDSLNKLVWVDRQRKTTGKEGIYGKDARRFSNNSQARAYAIKLAKEKQGKVYDKYFEKYLPSKTKRKPRVQRGFGMNYWNWKW